MPKRLATKAERAEIVAAFAGMGWPAPEVDAVVNIESGWNARALNPTSKAAGLIQIMPSNLKRLGFTAGPAAFALLDPLAQLPWMLAYWRNTGKKFVLPGDTYLVVAAPSFVGKPSATVVYKQGSKAWEQNPLWRPAGGGDITAGSIRALVLRRLPKPVAGNVA